MQTKTKRSTVIKKIITMGVVLIMAFSMTACSQKEAPPEGLDESRKLLPVEAAEINYEGTYYIKSGTKKTLYPLSYRGVTEDIGNNSYLAYTWFTEGYENYIPELKKGDSVVYVNIEERPSSTSFIEMQDCGFSVGAKFGFFEENGETAVGFTDVFCPYSPIGTHAEQTIADYEATMISEINETAFKRNMVDTNGFIHGLEKNCMYNFGFYEGTVFKTLSLKADTHFFLSKTQYSSTSYKAHKDIYYEVVLPENLPNGYYLIPEAGMFKYNIEDNVILPDGIEVPAVNDATSETETSAGTEATTVTETSSDTTVASE